MCSPNQITVKVVSHSKAGGNGRPRCPASRAVEILEIESKEVGRGSREAKSGEIMRVRMIGWIV